MSTTTILPITAAERHLLYPLSLFRQRDHRPVPEVAVLNGLEVPPPYYQLLVHEGDMTSRLETFHGGKLELEVRHCEHSHEAYRREVVLRVAATGLAVEYGAIEIVLAEFAPALQRLIVEGRLPLGGLLNTHQVPYHSQPRAFIRMGLDAEMEQIFGVPEAERYFGRCNELRGSGDRVLARIVEILRPV